MQPIIKKENILFDVEAKDKDDMIKQMGIETFNYETFKVEGFKPDTFEVNSFTFDTFEPDNLKLTFLRRGVIGISKIGYV